jgi:hypothetical protein
VIRESRYRQSINAINVSYCLYLALKVFFILPFMNMDLISAPSGENSSLTKPVVSLGVVDAVSAAEQEKIISTDGLSSFEGDETPSEGDVDSDNSDDPWETESLYEDALQIVRDDQLQGGTPNPPDNNIDSFLREPSSPQCMHGGRSGCLPKTLA